MHDRDSKAPRTLTADQIIAMDYREQRENIARLLANDVRREGDPGGVIARVIRELQR